MVKVRLSATTLSGQMEEASFPEVAPGSSQRITDNRPFRWRNIEKDCDMLKDARKDFRIQ